MLISVIIASVRAGTLEAAVRSIQQQTWTDWELLIVAQGSDPGLAAACERIAPSETGDSGRIHVIRLTERGLSRARNAGVAAARGDILAFTDDDCEAAPDWLATLAACFTEDPEVGLVGGSLVAPPAPLLRFSACPASVPADTRYDPRTAPGEPPAGFKWAGGNFAVRRAVVERIGPFDPLLGAGTRFAAGEDTDYLLRLEAAGVPMRSTPRSVIHHTYGRRLGWRAVLAHSDNYAAGNGATAGKLTLAGDSRGEAWWKLECGRTGLWRGGPVALIALPMRLRRLKRFRKAYQECVDGYMLKQQGGAPLLAPRPTDDASSRRPSSAVLSHTL